MSTLLARRVNVRVVNVDLAAALLSTASVLSSIRGVWRHVFTFEVHIDLTRVTNRIR